MIGGLSPAKTVSSVSNPVQPKIALSGGTAFNVELNEARTKTVSSGETVKAAVDQFINSWGRAEEQSSKLIQTLPPDVRPLFAAQQLVQRLSLQTQFVTKIADTVTGTVRRVQQLGS